MSKVKRPSLMRYPKRPKASASLDAWKRYDERCRNCEKTNNARLSDYTKRVNGLKSAKKSKEAIQKKSLGRTGIALSKGKRRR